MFSTPKPASYNIAISPVKRSQVLFTP